MGRTRRGGARDSGKVSSVLAAGLGGRARGGAGEAAASGRAAGLGSDFRRWRQLQLQPTAAEGGRPVAFALGPSEHRGPRGPWSRVLAVNAQGRLPPSHREAH